MEKQIVTVSCRNVRGRIDPRTIRRRLLKILSFLELDGAEVSCVLCDDAFIQELNRSYRGRDKPTDVLSFSMNEGDVLQGDSRILGDIVISVETALRQGEELGHTLLEEMTSLLIHGLLHLLGHDHQTRGDEKAMWIEHRKLERLFS